LHEKRYFSLKNIKKMFTKYSVRDLAGYHKGLYCIKWNKDGDYLAAISGDRSVRVSQFNPSTTNAEIIHTIPTPTTMAQLCWNPQESGRLAVCNDDKPVELWDIRASKASMKIQTLGGNINMDWSPCGNYIVVGNKSDYLVVLDVRTGNQIRKKKFLYEVSQ
jgi:WD40 repeat protein